MIRCVARQIIIKQTKTTAKSRIGRQSKLHGVNRFVYSYYSNRSQICALHRFTFISSHVNISAFTILPFLPLLLLLPPLRIPLLHPPRTLLLPLHHLPLLVHLLHSHNLVQPPKVHPMAPSMRLSRYDPLEQPMAVGPQSSFQILISRELHPTTNWQNLPIPSFHRLLHLQCGSSNQSSPDDDS